jgi:hypothetical protein
MSSQQLFPTPAKTRKALRLFSLSLLSFVFLATLGLRFAARAGDDHACKAVSGSISASPILSRIPATVLGTVTGDLRGAVAALVTSPLPVPDGGSFTLQHTFLTEARDSLFTEDTAQWVLVDNGVFRMTTQYTIVGGTGKFANASGQLENHGEVDLNRGQLTLGYSGQVCRGGG